MTEKEKRALGLLYDANYNPESQRSFWPARICAFSTTRSHPVWFGANVTVLPGVTIGSNTVIAAGSVVNRNIPAGVVAAGNPCRVILAITNADQEKYSKGLIHHS